MKKQKYLSVYLLVWVLITFVSGCFAQPSTTQYTFSSGSEGMLTDMSSGTVTLIPANTDGLNNGTASSYYDLGFTFYFMGLPYQQFTVTEDGVIRLGTSLAAINRVPELNVDEPRLVAFGTDMRTGNNGKVHFRMIGSEPNRVLVVEWLNMCISYPATTDFIDGNSTFQIRLYETTGVIEYVYGYMKIDNAPDVGGAPNNFGAIGFCNGTASNIYKTVNFISSDVGRNNSGYTNRIRDFYNASGLVEISGLSSTSEDNRRIYTFTPRTAPVAPSNLTFTGITTSAVTLNWIDNAGSETNYLVYLSNDGGVNYTLVQTLAANSTNTTVSDLVTGSTYTFKILAVNEGAASTPLTGSQATLTAGVKYSNVASGMWNSADSWSPAGVPASTDDVFIRDGHTIYIDVNAACHHLTVGEGSSGNLLFNSPSGPYTLTVEGNVTINAGANFSVYTNGSPAGAYTLVVGNRAYSKGDLKVDGTLDFNNGNYLANVELKGYFNGTVSGSGATCNFNGITVNKGSGISSVVEFTRVFTMASPAANTNLITLTNGTLKISSAVTINPFRGTVSAVASTGRLWLNNASAIFRSYGAGTASHTGNATIDGILQISAGTFEFGSGNNTLTLNASGTIQLESSDANLMIYGNAFFSDGSKLFMTAGNLKFDPQAANNLSSGHVCQFDDLAIATCTGGTILFTDPKNYDNSQGDFYIPPAGEISKNFLGCTIQFGDGASTSAGNATAGFTLMFPTQYILSLGNISVNNPGGSNRFVRIVKSDGHANNMIITGVNIAAGEFRLNGLGVELSQNLTNNGTINASTSGSTIIFKGTTSQSYSGSGSISATNNLRINMNNTAGLVLNAPLAIRYLDLTRGKITTTSTNILTINADGTSANGSSASFIKGPLKRILPASLTGTTTYNFPIGKSNTSMFELVNVTTTAGGTVEVIAEVFDQNSGGSYSHADYYLSTSKYWYVYISAGGSNYTSSYIRINEPSSTTGMFLARSDTKSGLYTDISVSGGASGNSIISQNAISCSPADNIGYFATSSNFMAGEYLVGAGQTYTTLTGAANSLFAAINSRGLKGNVTAKITSNLTETGATALNQWNETDGIGWKVTIQPDATTTRIISGTVTTNPMININGADSVIFDGGSGKYLVFRNTTTTAGSTGPVFLIDNNAEGVKILNSVIESNQNSTSSGAIVLGTTGTNQKITISNNNITASTGGTIGIPYYLLYSYSTGNKKITVSGNSIYNFSRTGIYFRYIGDSSSVVSNHFFDNQSPAPTGSQTAIIIIDGNALTVSGNFIGGRTTSCGGGNWQNASGTSIRGIYIYSGTTNPSRIDNNTIQHFDVQGTSGTAFYGILVAGGNNLVGTTSGNIISDITSGATDISGIRHEGSSYFTCRNNQIHDFSATSTGNAQLRGIHHTGTGMAIISDNLIYNFTASSVQTDVLNQTISGINAYGASTSGVTINGNTIYNLSATNTGTVQTNVSGIVVTAATSPQISKNKIYNLTNLSTRNNTGTPATASGITAGAVVAGIDVANNVISLGNGTTTNTQFAGIWLNTNPSASVSTNIFYNTVVISGTVSSGAISSFGLIRGQFGGTTPENFVMNYKNNAFINFRSGGTGGHYAISNQGASTGWGNTSNYNLLVSNSSSQIGYFGGFARTFTQWKSVTGCDARSLSAVYTAASTTASQLNAGNLFTNIAGGDLSVKSANTECWFLNGQGTQLTIATDYAGNVRYTAITSGATDIGAYEFTPSVDPVSADQTGSIADGNTTTYTFAGKTYAAITWHGSDFPTVDLKGFIGKNPADDALGTLAGTRFGNGFWRITATGGDIANYTYDLTLYYDESMMQTIDDESAMNIAKNPYIYPLPTSTPENAWRSYPCTRDISANTVTASSVIGFSDFTLEQGESPLPVELLYFTPYPHQGKVIIHWATASESENSGFMVEKSTDCKNWIRVDFVEGAGNSQVRTDYSITDQNPFYGLSYYRLQQFDFNGIYQFLAVKPVNIITSTEAFKMYYSLTNDALVIVNYTNNRLLADMEMNDVNGKVVKHLCFEVEPGNNQYQCFLQCSGVYFITVRLGGGIYHLKVVK